MQFQFHVFMDDITKRNKMNFRHIN